jgi:hypothetical protein
MTEILAILAAAVGVALFGYFMRGRPRACGSGCSCEALRRNGACRARLDRVRWQRQTTTPERSARGSQRRDFSSLLAGKGRRTASRYPTR